MSNIRVVVPTYLWSACTQNHSCMGSIPDSSAVREESGTETTQIQGPHFLLNEWNQFSRAIVRRGDNLHQRGVFH